MEYISDYNILTAVLSVRIYMWENSIRPTQQRRCLFCKSAWPTGPGLVPENAQFFQQLGRIEVGSRSHLKWTLVWDDFFKERFIWSTFGAHLSAIIAFTPAQKNCVKGGNKLQCDSAELSWGRC